MSAILDMSSTTEVGHPEGNAFRHRLKRLGWVGDHFATWFGVHKATLTKWRAGGPPLYAVRVLELMESVHVLPAKPDQDAKLAMFRAFSTAIDNARKAEWSRSQIARVMRQMADELEGPGETRE